MFEHTRKILDEFESAYDNIQKDICNVTKEDEDTIKYFNVNLAKALMQDEWILDESVAKIIFVTRDLSSDITVRVQ